MGYYISNIFGIRTGGVFSGKTDTADMKQRIASIVRSMRKTDNSPDLGDKRGDVSHCMSRELTAHKGSYIVLAGVFNYWTYPSSSEFAKRLSEEFGTEVMHMCWNEEQETVQCNIWLSGRSLFEIVENPIGRVLRRVT